MKDASQPAPIEVLDQGREATLVALGRGDLAQFATLQDGLSYFDTSFGYVAYKQIGGVAITLGAPICTLEDEPEMVRRFVANIRHPLFFYLRCASLPAVAEAGLFSASIGVDRSADLKRLLAGPPKVVKGALRHARRDGVRWVEQARAAIDAPLLDQMRTINQHYLAQAQCSVEMSFLNRPVRPDTDRGRRFLLLQRTDQHTGSADTFGYAALSPIHRSGKLEGWLLDALRFRPTRTWGLWLSTVHHLATRLSKEGSELHLGFSPLHRIVHPRTIPSRLLQAQMDTMASLLAPNPYLTRLRLLKDTIPGVYDPRFMASYTRRAPMALRVLLSAMGMRMRRMLKPELLTALRSSVSNRL